MLVALERAGLSGERLCRSPLASITAISLRGFPHVLQHTVAVASLSSSLSIPSAVSDS